MEQTARAYGERGRGEEGRAGREKGERKVKGVWKGREITRAMKELLEKERKKVQTVRQWVKRERERETENRGERGR